MQVRVYDKSDKSEKKTSSRLLFAVVFQISRLAYISRSTNAKTLGCILKYRTPYICWMEKQSSFWSKIGHHRACFDKRRKSFFKKRNTTSRVAFSQTAKTLESAWCKVHSWCENVFSLLQRKKMRYFTLITHFFRWNAHSSRNCAIHFIISYRRLCYACVIGKSNVQSDEIFTLLSICA